MILPSVIRSYAVTIPDNGWTDYSEVFGAPPETYLASTLVVASASLFLEAVRMVASSGGGPVPFYSECQRVADRINIAAESAGSLELAEVYGHDYLILATPYSQESR